MSSNGSCHSIYRITKNDMETFSKNNHTIYSGDVVESLREIDDGSVALIFIDPPYNIGKDFIGTKDRLAAEDYYAWCNEWLDLCIKKLTPSGSLYLMAATQYMPRLDIQLSKRMTVLSRIVWHYDSSGVQAKKYFGSLYEPILFAVKNKSSYTFNTDDILVEAKTGAKRRLIDYRGKEPKLYSTKKVPSNVWYFPRVRYRMPEYENHPSQKPESLLERIIKASSNVSDTVLDPFAGTFTTNAVAKKLGRKSIGIELEEEYVKVGLRRLGIQQTYNGEILKAPQKSTKKVRTNNMKTLL